MLYHFTRIDSCIKMLLSDCIKFSPSKDIDDPFERKRFRKMDISFQVNNQDQACELNNEFVSLLDSTNIACFFDSVDQHNKNIDPLVNLKMWSHYGFNHKGCCLIFDKSKLINTFTIIPDNIKKWNGRVIYNDTVKLVIPIDQKLKSGIKSVAEIAYNNKFKNIFSLKSKYYKGENEYRFVIDYSQKKYTFTISDNIVSIVFGENVSEDDMICLNNLCNASSNLKCEK